MRLAIAVLGIVAWLAACDGCRPSVVLVPAPGPVGAGDGGDICSTAMRAAAACQCPWAWSQDAGTSIAAVACRRDQAQGSASQLSPACLAAAADCIALKQCAGVTGCP
jgi:hypothetical protein